MIDVKALLGDKVETVESNVNIPGGKRGKSTYKDILLKISESPYEVVKISVPKGKNLANTFAVAFKGNAKVLKFDWEITTRNCEDIYIIRTLQGEKAEFSTKDEILFRNTIKDLDSRIMRVAVNVPVPESKGYTGGGKATYFTILNSFINDVKADNLKIKFADQTKARTARQMFTNNIKKYKFDVTAFVRDKTNVYLIKNKETMPK